MSAHSASGTTVISGGVRLGGPLPQVQLAGHQASLPAQRPEPSSTTSSAVSGEGQVAGGTAGHNGSYKRKRDGSFSPAESSRGGPASASRSPAQALRDCKDEGEERKEGEGSTLSSAVIHMDPVASRNRPTPLLPLPLPSKRFKKTASAKALLIPVELLPVYPLPPLPPIADPVLAKQVFNHISLYEKVSTKFEDPVDRPTEHYEKLEHVGDSILGMVVTTWLQEIMPRLTCGTATKLKAHLVSNATLSHLSGMYALPQRLQGDPNLLPVLRAQTDTRAAMMEAYIAALYFSFPPESRFTEGLKVIDRWLRSMYEPMLDFFYRYMKNEYEQHHLTLSTTLAGTPQLYTEEEIKRIDKQSQGMANLLQMYCYRQGREVRYAEERIETHCGILWRLKCLVGGEEVGQATRSGRKVAKNVAAWEACKALGLVEAEGVDAPSGLESASDLLEDNSRHIYTTGSDTSALTGNALPTSGGTQTVASAGDPSRGGAEEAAV